MDIRQYSINVIEAIRKYDSDPGAGVMLGLPTLVQIRPDQHKAATGKPDGFLLCMADSVPVKVLSTVTEGKVKFYRKNSLDVAEMDYAADTNPPYGWRE